MSSEISPYDTPESDLALKPNEVVEIQMPVGRWLRLANFVIDYVVMIVLVGLLYFLIGFVVGEEGAVRLESIFDSIPDLVFGAGMFLIYYLPLETLTGRTVGKLVTGTKIVTEEGTKPSFKRVIGRTLSRLVPFEPLSFFGKERRGWHDTWPGIYVVKNR